MSGVFERYKFQYQTDFTDQVPYEGRDYNAALYEKDGPIARITLNRPEKRNAMNDAMFGDLLAGLHEAREDDEVKVVIIKGAGSCFTSGHDLTPAPGEETPPVNPSFKPNIRDYFNIERRRCGKYDDLFNFPKPFIAQVHGYCIGAGEYIVAACDLAVAAEDAQFGIRGFGRMDIGVHYWPGIWPVKSERYRASRLLPEISGKEAATIGMINKAVPLDKLQEEVNKWAEAICHLPVEALAIQKQLINGTLEITGQRFGTRSHHKSHISIQFVRFRPDEVSFYKEKRDKGLKSYLETRAVKTTPKGVESA